VEKSVEKNPLADVRAVCLQDLPVGGENGRVFAHAAEDKELTDEAGRQTDAGFRLFPENLTLPQICTGLQQLL
jgi:hypothetical protein